MWTAPLLTSCFFLAALLSTGLAALLTASLLAAALLASALLAGRLIALRIAAWRLLLTLRAARLSCAASLLLSLISFSVVCHFYSSCFLIK